jgi:hypothetical protein
MAPHDRPPFDHHLERPEANATLDAASVEAVARRVVELMRGEGSSSVRGLVDAATLAAELGVTRSWGSTNTAPNSALYGLGLAQSRACASTFSVPVKYSPATADSHRRTSLSPLVPRVRQLTVGAVLVRRPADQRAVRPTLA